jgi:hypothetical protein
VTTTTATGTAFPNTSSIDDNARHVFYHPGTLALDGSAVLEWVTIEGGNADDSGSHGYGGGMMNTGCSPSLSRCVFRANRADHGGAIANDSAHPSLVECLLAYNQADDGGAMNNQDSSPSINRCTFAENRATSWSGGAVNNDDSAPAFTNCTFAGNFANFVGGAVYNYNSGGLFMNCTFSGNSGRSSAGGIDNFFGDPVVTNCIFWGNLPTSFNDTDAVVTHSVVEGGYAGGTSILTSDPLLLPFGDHGGPTPTMPVGFSSPAVNAGTSGAGVPVTDQRGNARDASPDIGACELNPVPGLVVFETTEGLTQYAAGFRTSLQARSEGTGPTFTWFLGSTGDETMPLGSTSAPSFPLPPLSASASYWVKITHGGGSLNSDTLSLTVTPAIVHVATTGSDGNDGSSWALAKRSLSDAITNTGLGGQVWIAQGTYRPNDADPGNLSIDQSFRLKNGVSVIGGFNGTETSADQRFAGSYPVYLSGDLMDNDADSDEDGFADNSTRADNCRHVFDHPAGLGLDHSAVLDSVVVTGGAGGYSDGGGMHNHGSSPTVRNCTFRWNSGDQGGAIYNRDSDAVFVNCTLAGNSADEGGGVYNDSGASSWVHCTFTGNASTEDPGGGIFNYSSDPDVTLENCLFWNNTPNSISGIATASHCVVQGGFPSGTDIATADPRLLPYGWHGGPTPTLPLSAGSSALDAGLTGGGLPVIDQRGLARDGQPDIGACEMRTVPTSVAITTLEGGFRFAAGYAPTVIASAEGEELSYAWYSGPSGDESNPLASGSQTITLEPLSADVSVWVKVSFAGGSVNSPAMGLTATPAVIHLSTGGDDTADGATWLAAKRSLRAAMDAAAPGAQVWIAQGTYYVNDPDPGNPDRSQSIQLKDLVAVLGGFEGFETDPSLRDPAAHPVVVSGDLARNDADADADGKPDAATISDNAYHVFRNPRSAGLQAGAMLDSVTVTAGNASDYSEPGGGGMLNEDASPTIVRCRFIANSGRTGAAVYTIRGGPVFSDCVFADNESQYQGGAIFNSDSNPEFRNCTFARNTSTFSYGGAVYNSQSNAVFLHCTVAGNHSASGAAVHNNSSDPVITNTILWGNSPAQLSGGSPAVSHCVIQGGFPAGTNVIADDPLLLALDIHGGATETMPAGFGSPSIDGGITGAGFPAADQRGFARDTSPDIGACELQPIPTAAALSTALGDKTFAAGYRPTLHAASEGIDLSYTWFLGAAGDTSQPLGVTAAPTFLLPPLASDSSYWVRISFAGGTLDSDAITLTLGPSVIHLSTTGDDTDDGLSWASAKRTLEDALGAACPGSEVWVREGTYYPNDADPSDWDRNQSFQLKNAVTVRGGFAGTETSVSQRTPGAHTTTFSGDLRRDDVDSNGDGIIENRGNNTLHVFSNSNLDSTTVLEHVTVEGGYAVEGISRRSGAAMVNFRASLTIRDCVFFDHFAGRDGGGVHNTESHAVFERCTFMRCRTGAKIGVNYYGGAVCNSVSNATFSDCMFSECSSGCGGAVASIDSDIVFLNCSFPGNRTGKVRPNATPNTEGGAVYQSGGNISLENCVFENNEAHDLGGAIAASCTSASFIGCEFRSNTADDGGAVISDVEDALYKDCILENNQAGSFGDGRGGAVHASGTDATFTGCEFSQNNAADDAGAVFSANLHAAFVDCSFRQNTAVDDGGAVATDGSEAVMTRCTFSRNEAGGIGGAVVIFDTSSGTALTECAFTENQAENGGALICSSAAARTERCSFAENVAIESGGAVYNVESTPHFTNCTFHGNRVTSTGNSGIPGSGNASGGGGAMMNSGSNPAITNCTFAGNTSAFRHVVSYQGPGSPAVFAYSGVLSNVSSTPVLKNCILWGNFDTQIVGYPATVSNCIIEGGYAGTNVSSANPLLTTIGDHGGPTPTIPIAYGSPAINAGASGAGIPAEDQRGLPRTGAPDLGACEFTAFAVETPDLDPYVPIGSTLPLMGISDHTSPAFQWFRGASGDTSDPITPGSTYTTPALEFGTRLWVRLTSAASGTLDSNTIDVPVRGTYADWCVFHNLSGPAAHPHASPAGDGITNLLKFAAGLSPAEREELPVAIAVVSGSFECSATLSKTPLDLETGFFRSMDLLGWDPPLNSPVATDAGPAVSTVTLSEPGVGPRKFMSFRAGVK